MNKYILTFAIIIAPLPAHAQYVVIQPPPIQAPAPIPSIPPYIPMPSTVSPFIPQPVQPLQIPQYQSHTPTYTNCAGVGAYMNCTTR
jgi:hypothetical protein